MRRNGQDLFFKAVRRNILFDIKFNYKIQLLIRVSDSHFGQELSNAFFREKKDTDVVRAHRCDDAGCGGVVIFNDNVAHFCETCCFGFSTPVVGGGAVSSSGTEFESPGAIVKDLESAGIGKISERLIIIRFEDVSDGSGSSVCLLIKVQYHTDLFLCRGVRRTRGVIHLDGVIPLNFSHREFTANSVTFTVTFGDCEDGVFGDVPILGDNGISYVQVVEFEFRVSAGVAAVETSDANSSSEPSGDDDSSSSLDSESTSTSSSFSFHAESALERHLFKTNCFCGAGSSIAALTNCIAAISKAILVLRM